MHSEGECGREEGRPGRVGIYADPEGRVGDGQKGSRGTPVLKTGRSVTPI